MKIGIVTYYKAINNGAFLQAYCLKHFLEEILGGDVRFVPFSDDIIAKDILKGIKNPLKFINVLKRYYAISKMQKKELLEGMRNEYYDLVVVGSDEVWNICNKVFTMENLATGLNSHLYCTYAVSLGNTSESNTFPLAFDKELEKFTNISVRDDNSKKVITQKSGKDISIHLDPVFLCDIPHSLKHRTRKPYIMIYGGITEIKIIQELQSYAKNNGVDIIAVDTFNSWCKTVTSKDPFDFVDYIREAECVVTNMFHGTMLSILLKKRFITILTEARSKKMSYAIRVFGVENHTINQSELVNNPKYLSSIIEKPLNKKSIDAVILCERKKAADYFLNVKVGED